MNYASISYLAFRLYLRLPKGAWKIMEDIICQQCNDLIGDYKGPWDAKPEASREERNDKLAILS